MSVPCKEAIEVMLEVYESLRVESTPLDSSGECEWSVVEGLMIFLGRRDRQIADGDSR